MVEGINIPYSFASDTILSNGKKICHEFKNGIVKSDGFKQTDFVKPIRGFANKIDFNSKQIAEKFWPAGEKVKLYLIQITSLAGQF